MVVSPQRRAAKVSRWVDLRSPSFKVADIPVRLFCTVCKGLSYAYRRPRAQNSTQAPPRPASATTSAVNPAVKLPQSSPVAQVNNVAHVGGANGRPSPNAATVNSNPNANAGPGMLPRRPPVSAAGAQSTPPMNQQQLQQGAGRGVGPLRGGPMPPNQQQQQPRPTQQQQSGQIQSRVDARRTHVNGVGADESKPLPSPTSTTAAGQNGENAAQVQTQAPSTTTTATTARRERQPREPREPRRKDTNVKPNGNGSAAVVGGGSESVSAPGGAASPAIKAAAGNEQQQARRGTPTGEDGATGAATSAGRGERLERPERLEREPRAKNPWTLFVKGLPNNCSEEDLKGYWEASIRDKVRQKLLDSDWAFTNLWPGSY